MKDTLIVDNRLCRLLFDERTGYSVELRHTGQVICGPTCLSPGEAVRQFVLTAEVKWCGYLQCGGYIVGVLGKVCDRCRGLGSVHIATMLRAGPIDPFYEPCPDCRAGGLVKPIPLPPFVCLL